MDSASIAATKRTRRVFHVRATDENSGISAVQVSTRRSGRGPLTKRVTRRTKRGKRAYNAKLRLQAPAGRVWVRVLDAAGNPSPWRRPHGPAAPRR